jgi:hypothetical protein
MSVTGCGKVRDDPEGGSGGPGGKEATGGGGRVVGTLMENFWPRAQWPGAPQMK